MAKIYETKDDYQKDVIKDQVKDLRLEASRQSGWGATWIGGSFLTDLWREKGIIRGRGPGLVSAALSVFGIVDIVRSWMTSSKAHTLELQRERMGPSTVVLPPDALSPPQNDGIDPSCGCPLKRHAMSGPTSLIEQAMRGDSVPTRE